MVFKVGKGSNCIYGVVKRWGWEMFLGVLFFYCVFRMFLVLFCYFFWVFVKDGGFRVRRFIFVWGIVFGSRGDGGRCVIGVLGV